jgi:pSer/pThr/pTyr-binding forkhead associated (FHA) protein
MQVFPRFSGTVYSIPGLQERTKNKLPYRVAFGSRADETSETGKWSFKEILDQFWGVMAAKEQPVADKLVWVERPTGVFLVPGRCVYIGRSESNDLPLKDDFVSARHAVLLVDVHGEFWMSDLNSTNGIRIRNAGQKELHQIKTGKAYLLREGDEIIFSSKTRLRITDSQLMRLTKTVGPPPKPSELPSSSHLLRDSKGRTLKSESLLDGARAIRNSNDPTVSGAIFDHIFAPNSYYLFNAPYWITYSRNLDDHSPWKFHVYSDNLEDLAKLLDVILPVLRKKEMGHKFMTPYAAEHLPGTIQAGKGVTVYPQSERDFLDIAKGLEEAIQEAGLSLPPGSAEIVGDAPMPNSASGRLHYRFAKDLAGFYRANDGKYCPTGVFDVIGMNSGLEVGDGIRIGREVKTEMHHPVNLDDTCVSRRHAVISRVYSPKRKQDILVIQDTGSRNGTYIVRNEELHRLSSEKQYPLEEEDIILLGTKRAKEGQCFQLLNGVLYPYPLPQYLTDEDEPNDW